ncbi:hypothetical protein H310_08562 [Aphanomyces invadans]|uniref:MOSC domain-containing protein n=1 Tax=Aphanomyces invadans TaxID=157072 RepID=A0A024TYT6_9STRA|nr:hypothetical protein H310_08562 [Aphanomyces invadans]ETV99159.1 hypothetical protein H310_08562 [Aphanomyces invadans]|eukprot:XP_008872587.1 hypothetical protein H310_08562 [Aphanomyces invadans]
MSSTIVRRLLRSSRMMTITAAAAFAAAAVIAAPPAAGATAESPFGQALRTLQEHPWTSAALRRPLDILSPYIRMEYAVLGLAFVTMTASFLMPYLMSLLMPSSLSDGDARGEIEQAILTARLDAASKRSNAYPPQCPVRMTRGDDAVVQQYNSKLGTYTLTSCGRTVDVPESQVAPTTVTDLFIYPIKSCAGIRVAHSHVLRQGLQFDRQWLIVDGNNDFVTQRKVPKMALICPILTPFDPSTLAASPCPAQSITLTATDHAMKPLVVPVLSHGVERNVRVWKDRVDAIDQGDEAAAWVATFLGHPSYRLVRLKDSFKRPCDPAFAPDHETGFADGFPILIAASSSLDVLERELQRPIGMERFRPNIVVSGCPPWADDVWQAFEIGRDAALRFRNVKPCSRCSIPSVNPTTGLKDDDEVVTSVQDVLKAHRNGKELGFLQKAAHEVFFGSNVVCDKLGALSVGDVVKVLTVKSP